MTEAEKINQLEREVASLKNQVDFINKKFGLVPDRRELDQAIELMLTNRDTSALAAYLQRGGKITGATA